MSNKATGSRKIFKINLVRNLEKFGLFSLMIVDFGKVQEEESLFEKTA